MRVVDDREGELSLGEAAALGAVDSAFFSRFFFPKTCRQDQPTFERAVWDLLDNPKARYTSLMIFRGGAKTTRARIFTAKRIAYGLSRTILYVGKSQDHAARSIEWILKQIQFNPTFAATFGLEPGSKWTGTEVEILHKSLNITIRVLALGITGSVRGVNIDDYRPDLIVCDDITDEENSATKEQRQKIEDLVFGALKESLAPASETPDAKMVLLGTPMNPEDINVKCFQDEQWKSLRVGLLDAEGKSVWESRFPTREVLLEKEAAIRRNQLSLWLREKECTLISRESSFFNIDNLRYWDILPDDMTCVMVIDPVPPRTETQLAKELKTDFEALTIVGRFRGSVYVLEYAANRGHNPEWTLSEFFRLLLKWKPRRVIVHAIAYEKTLAWLLRNAMKARGHYAVIEEFADRRSKRDRINDGLAGIIANREFYVSRDMTDLVAQIGAYPTVNHDDIIETAAIGAEKLLNDETLLDAELGGSLDPSSSVAPLPEWRPAP